MRALFLCLVLSFLPAFLAQNGINTGEGLHSLLFPVNGGGVELGIPEAKQTLAVYLPFSFSFEAWIMLPNPPADGYYKTMVSRWIIGPDGLYHNRWAEFDFQVQASGTLNFFMGNGAPSIYGFNLGTQNLAQGIWYHVAFTIDCCAPGTVNPTTVQVFLDGVRWTQNWSLGTRQIAGRTNIFLGDFFNHDGDHKWWRGYMDEVRFWTGVVSADQLERFSHRVVPSNTPGLFAYYRFNEGNGMYLWDSSRNGFTGQLSKPAINTTPLWRVSGAKIHLDISVPASQSVSLELLGLAPAGPNSFVYVISSLPTTPGYAGTYGRLVADGKYVTSTPFGLMSNKVTFEAGNLTGAQVTFEYFGTYDLLNPSKRERLPTTVFVSVGDYQCNPDACGVCNGDNSTCSCLPVPYQGYTLNDVERILVLYEIEETLNILSQFDSKIERAQKAIAQYQATELKDLVESVQGFVNTCLTSFCEKIRKYSDALSAL